MKDIDAEAHAIFEKAIGLPALLKREFEAVELIKSALAAYGDECAKQMREQALNALECFASSDPSFAARFKTGISLVIAKDVIRALPLPSERVKP